MPPRALAPRPPPSPVSVSDVDEEEEEEEEDLGLGMHEDDDDDDASLSSSLSTSSSPLSPPPRSKKRTTSVKPSLLASAKAAVTLAAGKPRTRRGGRKRIAEQSAEERAQYLADRQQRNRSSAYLSRLNRQQERLVLTGHIAELVQANAVLTQQLHDIESASMPSPDRLVDAGFDDVAGFTDTDDADLGDAAIKPELAFSWSDDFVAASAAAEAEATDDAAALFGLGATTAGYSDDVDNDDDDAFDVYCADALTGGGACDGYYLTAATAAMMMPDAFFALARHELD